jgi:rubredoxin
MMAVSKPRQKRCRAGLPKTIASFPATSTINAENAVRVTSGYNTMKKLGRIFHAVHYIAESLFVSKIQNRLVRCPVCGWLGCDSYYICPNCEWEYDESHLFFPDEDSASNGMSFNEYKQRYDTIRKRTRNKEM